MQKKGFLLPAIASCIIPGLGQLFKGHLFKAVLFWVAVGILYWVYHHVLGWIFWPIAFLGWIVNVLDAAFSTYNG